MIKCAALALECKERDKNGNCMTPQDPCPKKTCTKPIKPACILVGTDGNVFSVISKVQKALKQCNQKVKAKEFVDKAFQCSSYADVLKLVYDYVNVE